MEPPFLMVTHPPFRRPSVRLFTGLAAAVGLVLLCGCNDARLTGTLTSSSLSGNVDDGDAATPRAAYAGPRAAQDAGTTATSSAPTVDTVSGSVRAVPAATSSKTAAAKSFNRVLIPLVVTYEKPLSFTVTLNVQGVQLEGLGSVEILVEAAVLNASGETLTRNGRPLPNTSITVTNFKLDLNSNGNGQVTVDNQSAQPDLLSGDSYSRKLFGPGKGIALPPGDYTVELELRIAAYAPNTPRSRAGVTSATASIQLR